VFNLCLACGFWICLVENIILIFFSLSFLSILNLSSELKLIHSGELNANLKGLRGDTDDI